MSAARIHASDCPCCSPVRVLEVRRIVIGFTGLLFVPVILLGVWVALPA